MTTLEEDLRHLADALTERVVVPPFARLEARRRRRLRVRIVAVPALAAAAVVTVLVVTPLVHRPGGTDTATSTPAAGSGEPTKPNPAASHAPREAEPARACTSGDLRARFTLGARSAGRRLASIDLWNVAVEACSPGVAVTLEALAGNRVVKSTAQVPRVALTAAAHAAGPAGPAAGEQHLSLLLAGDERDDPARPDGLCRAADQVIPRQLVVTFTAGARITLPDTALSGLATCHGQLTVLAVEPVGAASS